MSFYPTTLSETIQRLLLGEATLSFDDNKHINVVSENGMATTVQIMDERLDKLEDLLKSCQLSRTAYPVEQNDQPLQRSFGLNCRTCGRNGHKASEYFSSSYCNSSWVNQRFNNNSRNYNNDNFLTEGTTISTPSELNETTRSSLEPSVVVIILDIIIMG